MPKSKVKNSDMQFVDEEGVQLAEWLENVLKNYCLDLAYRKIRPPDFFMPVDNDTASRNSRPITPLAIEQARKKLYLFITSIKFDKFKRELEETVEDLLKVEINYYVGDRSVVHNENFVIHISRPLQDSNPSIQAVLETDKREIDFYTKILPDLEDWARTIVETPFKFSIPICFFGEYQTDKPTSNFKVNLNNNTPSTSTATLGGNMASRSPGLSRAILILHDLEKINFKIGKDNKLTIGETKAALREIAEVHAVSYAFQTLQNQSLAEKFPSLLRPKDAIPVCVALIEEGISSLLKCISKHKFPSQAARVDCMDRLKNVQPKLKSILSVLLTPPKAPSPSSLIHLDLQSRNIAFRKADGSALPEKHNCNVDEIECRITQWKLVTVGSLMHDVAFLLLTSLTPEARRQHTRELIWFYFKTFRKVTRKFSIKIPFNVDFLEYEYEKSLFLALLLIVGNFEESMTNIPENILKCFLAAFEDVADSGCI